MKLCKTFVAILAVTALAAGCGARQQVSGRTAPDVDRKLTRFSYIEEGSIVTFIVSTKAARYRDDAGYMPLQISVANTGLRRITIGRESFTLVDEQGNRYPLAGPRELLESYNFLDMDGTLGELLGVLPDNKFAAFSRFNSNFSPDRGIPEIGGSSLVRDELTLPKFGYIIDTIYFPRPATGIKGHRFELFLDAPELENPVFVKFEVQ